MAALSAGSFSGYHLVEPPYRSMNNDEESGLIQNLLLAAKLNDQAMVHHDRGNYDEAILGYDKAIRLQPNLAEAFVNRGASYDCKGDSDRAIQDFNEGIRLHTQGIPMRDKGARGYFNRGTAHNRK